MRQQPNQRLMTLMAEAGCSNKGLARRITDLAAKRTLRMVRVDHNDVRKWRNLGMLPDRPKPDLIADILGELLDRTVSLTDIGMARAESTRDLSLHFEPVMSEIAPAADRLWTLDSEGVLCSDAAISAAALISPTFQWLTAPPMDLAAGGPRQVGGGDVAALTDMAWMFEAAEFRRGGGHVRASAVQFLRRQISPLLHGQFSDEVGRRLFAVAGQMALLVGDMSYDVANHALARRYFVLALNLAHASGDRTLGAAILVRMSHQATYLGEYREAADMARAARIGGGANLPSTAIAATAAIEARALSAAGDAKACDRALRQAETSFDRHGCDEDSGWFRYFDEAELLDEFGHCFRDLGRFPQAAAFAEEALTKSSPAYPRSRVFTRMVLATALLQSGDPDSACAEALCALTEMEGIQSARVRRYLADFYARVQTSPGGSSTDEFTEQAASLLATDQ